MDVCFFSKLPKDAPRLPIQWTAAKPKKKHARRGPGQSRKLCEPVVVDTDNSHDGLGATGNGRDALHNFAPFFMLLCPHDKNIINYCKVYE